eukprot:TRINITY_DN55010_c0_g1_i1.p1 TRINITY_DN55010_c0_g1~~TRINITY_DN55010_c0_g1_i1.p1  ORF type:complete len:303 (+),score=61.89 TRINITY_DN55010_c0_g1_i1:204-1112(+)
MCRNDEGLALAPETVVSRQASEADSATSASRPCPTPVALVGAGPGDPELLTLKALRRIEAADVVFHDSLISDEMLALIPPSVDLISVGKRCGDPKDRWIQQQEIHDLLLAHSRRGRRVVRLKCGDPFIFGRGGEEVEFLAKHGVPCEVIPGITSALGAAASSMVPLTHRSFGANHLQFVVGQTQARSLPDLDWAQLARSAPRSTIVFYMGLKVLDDISKRLLDHGAEGSTPMAVVEHASTPAERLLVGTLQSLPKLVKDAKINGPSVIFLGPTAAFSTHLEQCAEGRPLKRRCLNDGSGAAC